MKKEDDAWKRMETAGNAALATTEVEEKLKKKTRELQHHKPPRLACSAAVNKLKQANKESSVYYRRCGGRKGQKASSSTKS